VSSDDFLPEFDRIYAGEQLAEGIAHVPWNLGEPQPAIAEVIDAGEVRGHVLDAGCGVGATALHLADRGHRVLGVDASPSAIAQAEEAARTRGSTARFETADITELSGHDDEFDTVIDSTLFHSMPVEARSAYLASIARAAVPGAVLHVLVFSREVPFPEGTGPNAVTEDELRAAVGEYWTVDRVGDSRIAALLPDTGQPMPEVGEEVQRAMAALESDDKGRTLLPAFLLRAHLPG
jgi:2-heptyl-1-hydroxyquinolin-4(1H)-one methyltransferase